jgi:hypothetical protein
VPIDRDLIRRVRALDEYDLRRLTIFIRGLLLGSEGPEFEKQERSEPKVTYRRQTVKCGKRGCTRCPHGPYWYAYYREDGRLRSRYIGRELPAGVAAPE